MNITYSFYITLIEIYEVILQGIASKVGCTNNLEKLTKYKVKFYLITRMILVCKIHYTQSFNKTNNEKCLSLYENKK